MLELLLHALSDLKYSLREHGSDLLIRYGSAEKVIQELVKEVFIRSFIQMSFTAQVLGRSLALNSHF